MDHKEEKEIIERLARIETKIEQIEIVPKTAADARDLARDALQMAEACHRRLDQMEANQRWIWRTVGGTIISIVVGAFMKMKGVM